MMGEVVHSGLIGLLLIALLWALVVIGVLVAVHLSPLLLLLYVPLATLCAAAITVTLVDTI